MLDYLNSRDLNYRVEYRWVFPADVGQMKKAGWALLRGRRPVSEPVGVFKADEVTDSPPQDFEFIYQVKICRETFISRRMIGGESRSIG